MPLIFYPAKISFEINKRETVADFKNVTDRPGRENPSWAI